MTARHSALRTSLEPLYHAFNRERSAIDPIELVRPYESARDREIAGFVASALAFGNVISVIQSGRAVLERMGRSPFEYVSRFDPAVHAGDFAGVGHRWIRSRDIVALLWLLRQMLERSGSVEQFFEEGDDPAAADVEAGLESFTTRALALDLARAYGIVPARPAVAYFFTKPSQGSACKRLNLYLRWMARDDGVDLGVWSSVAPSRLIVPLDTHVIRLARCLRLTTYTSPGWRMAMDVTRALRVLDPADPIRFDFAICHVGMMGGCGYGEKRGSAQCPLKSVCKPAKPVSRPSNVRSLSRG